MSIILDALHRSDRDREQADGVPGLQTYHGSSAIPEPAFRRLIWVALVLALICAFAWFLLRDDSPDVVVDDVVVDDGVVDDVVVDVAAEVAETVRREGEPVVVTLPTSRPEPELLAKKIVADPGVAALYQRTDVITETESVAEVAPLVVGSAPASAVPATDGVPALAVDELLVAANTELMALDSEEDSTPLVANLPQRIKDEIPSIFYSNHSWSSRSGEKEVTLNGKLHHEGEVIVRDVRLLEIHADFIILEYKDTRFRLRALNSWVNL